MTRREGAHFRHDIHLPQPDLGSSTAHGWGMRDHTKLRAFGLGDELVLATYEATRAFPKEELFGLTSQLRRALYASSFRHLVCGSIGREAGE